MNRKRFTDNAATFHTSAEQIAATKNASWVTSRLDNPKYILILFFSLVYFFSREFMSLSVQFTANLQTERIYEFLPISGSMTRFGHEEMIIVSVQSAVDKLNSLGLASASWKFLWRQGRRLDISQDPLVAIAIKILCFIAQCQVSARKK